MPLVAIVTLIGVALTVAALVLYLIRVALTLQEVSATLETVIAGAGTIIDQTEPIGAVLDEINSDLAGVQAALEDLLTRKLGKARG